MVGQMNPRRVAILIALSLSGCAATPEPVSPPAPPALQVLPPGCPYASMYVSVSTNGAPRDAGVGERVELGYAETLAEQGFQLVAAPEEAYWTAFSLVRMSPRVDSNFAWSVYTMATQDMQGRIHAPIRFAAAGDDQAERSGFMFLKEVRILELDREVRRAAEETALSLLPHASRMCTAWTTDPLNDESPEFRHVRNADDLLEKLREELAREIIRIRRDRQQMVLEVDGEPSS
jgi:hypothetical protein